jgi:aspartyl-tRNA(Asn)/glutamyl-tRNA(Gln) amidotransferase subunit B
MLGQMVSLIENGTISGKIAKTVFEVMFNTGQSAEDIIKEQGLVQISDVQVLSVMIDEILQANEKFVVEYKSGKDKLFGFFVGQVMKKTNGNANPAIVNQLLQEKLQS